MILDNPIFSQRYFFPRSGSLQNPHWVQNGKIRLACHSNKPHPNAKTLLYFHGNGEIVEDYIPDLEELFLDMQVNVFFAEYRGYGRSNGEPHLIEMFDDLSHIYQAIGQPSEEIIVFGRSIGSIYAIEFAKQYPSIAGLILESGIADPLERVLLRVSPEELGASLQEVEQESQQHLNHKAKLNAYSKPLLVLHTENDGLVDRSHADRNYEWAGSQEKKKHIFEYGDHNSILFTNLKAYIAEVHKFIIQL